MGLKPRAASSKPADIAAFVATIPDSHRATFDTLRKLMRQVAPDAIESLKWGTLAYDHNGSLFALSVSKKVVNCYILTIGLLAKHQDTIGHIPQSKCCLRFATDEKPPIAALKKVMKAAVAAS